MRAGDEKRTRTIASGSAAVTAARGADLASLAIPSDRGCPSSPWLMAANGPAIMGRRGVVRGALGSTPPPSPASQ